MKFRANFIFPIDLVKAEPELYQFSENWCLHLLLKSQSWRKSGCRGVLTRNTTPTTTVGGVSATVTANTTSSLFTFGPGSSKTKMINGWIHGPQRLAITQPLPYCHHYFRFWNFVNFLIKLKVSNILDVSICMYVCLLIHHNINYFYCRRYLILQFGDVCGIMIICTIVIGSVVVVIMSAKRLIPPPVYCDAGGCSCLVSVAVQLFSSAEPTWY